MASNKLKCRICGKEYDACRSAKTVSGAYRWQDVACCPEHGAEYLHRVLVARGEISDTVKHSAKQVRQSKQKNKPVEIIDDVVVEEVETEAEA